MNKETKEQRRKNVERALAINSLGGVEPSKDAMDLLEKYIEGEITNQEAKKIIIDKYQK